MPTRYLIIGAGAAAIAAAEAVRAQDAQGELTLLSDDPQGHYSRPGLAHYLSAEVSRSLLFPLKDADWKRLAARRVLGHATALDPANHRLYVAGGATLPYDRLLLATGTSSILPALPGADVPEVVKLDTLDDADRLIALAKRAKAAVVIGGGSTALQIVEGLRKHCRQVHYLLRGDRYWSNVLDGDESRVVMKRLEQQGVKVHPQAEAAIIQGTAGHVSALLTTDGDRIACDMVAIALGVAPRLEFARNAGLAVERGVLVNDRLATNAADIYAAGAVAQVYDPRAGISLLETLWSMARGQGAVAGRNMAGADERYIKPVAVNTVRLAGITTTIIGAVGSGRDADLIGIGREDSEAWRGLGQTIVAKSRQDANSIRLEIGDNTIAGAVLMGDQALSRPLQHLIGDLVDISSIRSRLLAPAAPIAQIVAEFANATPK